MYFSAKSNPPTPGSQLGPGRLEPATTNIYNVGEPMNVTMRFAGAALVALGVVTAGFTTAPAQAAAIVGSINTGVDGVGGLLALGALDPHYVMTASADPATPGPATYVASPAGGPFGFPLQGGSWNANGPLSQWIVPYADGEVSLATASAPGGYTFRTTFDLTGFVVSTAQITGQWAADEGGLDILLNGVSTGLSTPAPGFLGFTPFNIAAGFVAGVNTLDFVIFNIPQLTGNPIGLRVEGIVSAVPAPGSLALLALGLAALGLRRSRRG